IVGVLLTQTRTGFLALWLTGSVFSWRVSRRMFQLFAGATLVFVFAMVLVGGFRLSPGSLRSELARRVTLTDAAFQAEDGPLGVLIGPEPGKGAVSMVEVDSPGGRASHRELNANMH